MPKDYFLSNSLIALNVDFVNKSIQGVLELTITPSAGVLTELKLHCRQSEIIHITVNGVQADYSIADPMERFRKESRNGLSHAFEKGCIEAIRAIDDEELVIFIPKSIQSDQLNEKDASGTLCYSNLAVSIHYELQNYCTAVFFADIDPVSGKLPYMYVFNPFNQARWWMPCIDRMHERITYTFQIIAPKTVADAINAKAILPSQLAQWGKDDLAAKMIAISSGDLVENVAHPLDPTKTIWVYTTQTALNPSSILFSVGAFDMIPIHGWGRSIANPMRQNDVVPDDELDASNRLPSKGLIFVPRGYKNDAKISSFYLGQALDFFEQWVGTSYPFSSFKLVFVEDAYSSVISGATISIVSVDMLVDESQIDQVFESRLAISRSLAFQWFGHYLAPQKWEDLWAILGLANLMTGLFIRKLFGNNEFKSRLRADIEQLCRLDVNQLPLCPDPNSKTFANEKHTSILCSLLVQSHHPNDDDLSPQSELLMLKSPLVFHMLERKLSKNLIQKLANKLMVSTMSGELNSGLSTAELLKLVRKISGRLEVKEFADQWIFQSGCPVLAIRYHLNRKKMMIEVRIEQYSTNSGVLGGVSRFSGAFTVRVQEPGGTFDTEVMIEDRIKQYDIVYHTKYKRIRRRPKKGKKAAENEEEDEDDYFLEGDEGEVVVDAEATNNQEVGEKIVEPERITFEWIRVDPDNTWACIKLFKQDDFMWSAVLKQERDVSAHFEAIDALSKMKTMPSLNTLINCARDTNNFYRLRVFATLNLYRFDSEELQPVAIANLIKLYQEMFCIVDGSRIIPKRNEFSDFQDYYLQQAIIRALVRFKDARGSSPTHIRAFVLDLLRIGDNSGNEFSDAEWVALLVKLIGDAFIIKAKEEPAMYGRKSHLNQTKSVHLTSTDVEMFDIPTTQAVSESKPSAISYASFSAEDSALFHEALKQVQRQLLRDKVFPSFRNTVSASCLETLMKWQLAGLVPINIPTFLGYSRFVNSYHVRRVAFDALIILSGLKMRELNTYMAYVSIKDVDLRIRLHAVQSIANYFYMSLSGHTMNVVDEESVSRLKDELLFFANYLIKKSNMETDPRICLWIVKIASMANAFQPPPTEPVPAKPVFTIIVPKAEPTVPKVEIVDLGEVSDAPDMKMDVDIESMSNDELSDVLKPNPEPSVKILDKKPISLTLKVPAAAPKLVVKPIATKAESPVKQKAKLFMVSNSNAESPTKQKAPSLVLNPPAPKPLPVETSEPIDLTQNDVSYAKPASPVKQVKPTISFNISSAVKETVKDFRNDSLVMTPFLSRLCRKALLKLKTKISSIWFLEPVDPVAHNLPNYFDVVKKPMDMLTISRKLEKNAYNTAYGFADDVRLIFSNAMLFNPAGTQVYLDAEALSADFEEIWTKRIIPGWSASEEYMDKEKQILEDIMCHKDAALFIHPVDDNIYPDYRMKVKTPIALGTIYNRLDEQKYRSFLDIDTDMKLLFKNCFIYNRKGSVGYGLGKNLEAFYQKRVKALKLSMFVLNTESRPEIKNASSPTRHHPVTAASTSSQEPVQPKLKFNFKLNSNAQK